MNSWGFYCFRFLVLVVKKRFLVYLGFQTLGFQGRGRHGTIRMEHAHTRAADVPEGKPSTCGRGHGHWWNTWRPWSPGLDSGHRFWILLNCHKFCQNNRLLSQRHIYYTYEQAHYPVSSHTNNHRLWDGLWAWLEPGSLLMWSKPHPSKTRSKRVFLWRLTLIRKSAIIHTRDRRTADFAKTLECSGAFAKQVDQYCITCYTRD